MNISSDTMVRIRKLAPAIFALALFCFLMPFVTVSCTTAGASSTQLATLNGIELFTGKDVDVSKLTGGLGTGSTSTSTGSSQNGHINGQIGAGLALLALVVGLVVSLALRGRMGLLGAAGAGVVAFLALLWAKFAFDNYVANPDAASLGGSSSTSSLGSVQITAEYQLGFWAALLLSLIAAGAFGYFATQNAAAPAPTASALYPPPPGSVEGPAPPSP